MRRSLDPPSLLFCVLAIRKLSIFIPPTHARAIGASAHIRRSHSPRGLPCGFPVSCPSRQISHRRVVCYACVLHAVTSCSQPGAFRRRPSPLQGPGPQLGTEQAAAPLPRTAAPRSTDGWQGCARAVRSVHPRPVPWRCFSCPRRVTPLGVPRHACIFHLYAERDSVVPRARSAARSVYPAARPPYQAVPLERERGGLLLSAG